MSLKKQTNKQTLFLLWRQPERCCPHSLHLGLSGSFFWSLSHPPKALCWPEEGCRNSSLLAHTCLAGMQHHLKEEGQLLQGHIHHFSCNIPNLR